MKKAISVYALLFDKNLFTQDQAANLAEANQYTATNVVEDDMTIAFIQRDKADFVLNAFGEGQDFRLIKIDNGVAVLIGELVETAEKAAGYIETEDARITWSFTKQDDAKRVVTGPVLVPDTADLQGDFEFAEDIEEAAFKFMEDARNIGEMHQRFGGIGVPVESWIAREPMFVDKGSEFKIFPRGTWMMSVRVKDDKVWEKVRNGELTGFSIGFRGTREEA